MLEIIPFLFILYMLLAMTASIHGMAYSLPANWLLGLKLHIELLFSMRINLLVVPT